jgi:DivIVA domain-containing protein
VVRPTPEEIEARRFRLAQNGYDCESVDRFLAEIADGLREQPPASEPGPSDEFGRLGQEIAGILRTARDGAGAIKAEAEGQAAAVRSRAEVEAGELHKSAEREAAQIRVDAERQLEQATQALARANEQAAAIRAGADEAARHRIDELMVDVNRREADLRDAEQSAYLRLIGARNDLQTAIDRLLDTLDGDVAATADPVVDLTVAPPHVRTIGKPEPVTAPEPPSGAEGQARPEATPAAGEAAPGRERSAVGSVDLDQPAGSAGADPLLRMVRAAVGRAAEASTPEPPDREASAS